MDYFGDFARQTSYLIQVALKNDKYIFWGTNW